MADPGDLAFDFELLRELTETGGVPGYEDRIRDIVRREFERVADAVRSDGMGNVVGTIEGGDHEVVLTAHMDEIGFMVRHVDDEGFVAVDALGGWDPRVLPAQRVTIHTRDGDLPGVIGSPPPHTLDEEERESVPDVDERWIDLGLPAETVEERVEPGDLVSMDQTTEIVGEHVTGKALDDRLCLLASIEAARRADPDATIHLAATAQEEVGLRGAEALGVDLDPDLAIALDVTIANDVPGFSPEDHVTDVGDGVAIKVKDGGVLANPNVIREIRDVARTNDIDHQTEIMPQGATDTAGFQRSGGALPVGAISIPTRYLHTVTESAHHEDVAATIDLLTAFIEGTDGSTDYTL